MKVIQIVQSISNLSAGPTYSVGSISHCLNTIDQCEVQILASGKKHKKWHYQVRLALFNSFLEKKELLSHKVISYYLNVIDENNCIIHQHGIWRSMNLLPLFGKKKAKLVWSPRGMFSEWSMKHHWFVKSLFWYLLQKPALNKVDCFHATCKEESDDIRRLGFKQPITIVSNGVAIPKLDDIQLNKDKTIVFLSRIHTKKGVHLLIKAWYQLSAKYPDWDVKIAGVLDSDYANEMQLLVKSLDIPRIQFVGGVFAEEKTQLLASASLFVLPTYSENFGIAIAEALAHATPVITTINTPWQGLESKECGWCIENEESVWVDTLKIALDKSTNELAEMGGKGRDWMEVDFSWNEKAREMKQVYDWLIVGDDLPACVLLD